MLRLIILTFILLIPSLSFGSEHQKSTRIAVSPIKNLLNPTGLAAGPYNAILAEFNGLDLFFTPQARVDKMFHEFHVDCMFPASTQNMPDKEKYLQSYPVNTTHAFIFSLTEYKDTEEFTGKNVGIVRGLSMGGFKEKLKAQYVELETTESLIAMLAAQRIDGYVAYEIDASASYKALMQSPDFYAAEMPIYTISEAFVCHNTPANTEFINLINERILGLEKSGRLQEILNPGSQ